MASQMLKKKPEKRIVADVKAKIPVGNNAGSSQFSCDICGQEGLSEQDMRFHVLLEHIENQISCPFCDLEGTTMEEMTLHVNSQHLDLLTPGEEDANHKTDKEKFESKEADPGKFSKSLSPQKPSHTESTCHISEPPAGDKEYTTYATEPKNRTGKPNNISIQSSPSSNNSKRSRLFLEVPVNNKPPAQSSKSPSAMSSPGAGNKYSCPLCGWCTNVTDAITQHVNIAHLDAVTPTKPTVKAVVGDNENNNDLECPLCGWMTRDSGALERHINDEHGAELASPESRGPESPLDTCPVCGMGCDDLDSLQRHVEGHFSAAQSPGSEQDMVIYDSVTGDQQQQLEDNRKQGSSDQHDQEHGGNTCYHKQAEKNIERAVCKGQLSITDFYIKREQILQADTTGVDDGHSCTKGIIEALHKYYKYGPYGVAHYWLCSPADHYAASFGDKGWGCGYRNLQMLLSSLARAESYQQVLFNGRPVIPSLQKIQRLIETAWQKGFDRAGCEQLGGKLVGTTKWIGATEIVATLSSLKLRCQLVDFHTPTGPGSTHPRLLEWVKDYFKGADKFKAPIYLQHQGHSRTIIGMEQLKDGSLRLLLFDPSCRCVQMGQFLQDITTNLMRTLRRPVHTLKARQYQIVAIRGVLNEQEYQESKMLKSEQIP